MAFTRTFTLDLGPAQAGLALAAQPIDTAGVAVGSPVTAGFFEIGGGKYLWTDATFTDGFRGAVLFSESSTPETVLVVGAVEPDPGAGAGVDVPFNYTAQAGSVSTVTLQADDPAGAAELVGWKLVAVAGAGAYQSPVVTGATGPADARVVTFDAQARPFDETTIYELLPPADKLGYQLDLGQSLADTTAATVGGALHGGWAMAWGRRVLVRSTRILSLFGIGSTTVPAKSFLLDNANNPSSQEVIP